MTPSSPSILWVNGPFGGGKTSACQALVALDATWRLADPEVLGCFVRDAQRSHGEDFQCHPGWTRLVVAGLVALDPSPEHPVAVAMAVHDECRWRAIAGGLASAGHPVRHVVLDAAPTEIEQRIDLGFTSPGDEEGNSNVHAFRLSRLPVYQQALAWLRTETASALLAMSRTT